MISWSEHVKRVSAGEKGFTVVEVVWWDAVAFGVHGWSEEAATSLRETTAVGYLVYEDDNVISVASLVNTAHVGHGIVINKADIISWRDLT